MYALQVILAFTVKNKKLNSIHREKMSAKYITNLFIFWAIFIIMRIIQIHINKFLPSKNIPSFQNIRNTQSTTSTSIPLWSSQDLMIMMKYIFTRLK